MNILVLDDEKEIIKNIIDSISDADIQKMNNNIEIIAVLKGEYSSLGEYFFIRICNYIVICLRGFCASTEQSHLSC